MNSRMVQGTFDDLNPQTSALGLPGHRTVGRRTERARVPGGDAVWRRHGLLSFTLTCRAARPRATRSAAVGQQRLRDRWTTATRLRRAPARILDFADELGWFRSWATSTSVRISSSPMRRPSCVRLDGVTRWLLDGGWRNVLVEVNNECDGSYDHALLRPARVHELIARVAATRAADGRGCSSAPPTRATRSRGSGRTRLGLRPAAWQRGA